MHTHCLSEVLPSGEVAFSGHDSGGAMVTAPVSDDMAVKPSTVMPSLWTAAWMMAVWLLGTTNDTAKVSDFCCSSRRFADSSSRRAVFMADAAAVPVIVSCVLAIGSVRHTIGAE